ncbi:hypothetical protein JTE90_027351 [Oedothorax gibbosus]|uniref:Ionotropic glutamate receptor L-glutamate and glycine-binding domain-containing protein n=1 Tax=Oedothorax gibbosus TaxID=931172 RepID=A0AAV6W2P3_9ARAC|nr:hypothetical protein JTE90_027351 [Oedothorax gibbosus]
MIPSRLRVSLIPDTYFTLVNESLPGYQRVSGAFGEFLNIIAKHLGFEYDFVYPEEFNIGVRKDDGNWTGIIGILSRGEADLSLNHLSMEFHRQEVVDFGTVYAAEEVIYFIEKPNYEEIPIFGFLYPFDFTVWLCFAVTVLFIATFLYFISQKRLEYGDTLLTLLASVLKQPLKINCYQNKEHLIFLFWLFFALVISVAYSAKLLSFLTIPLKKPQIQTFEELYSAVEKETHQCFYYENGYVMGELKQSKTKYLNNLRNAIIRNSWYLDGSDYPYLNLVTENLGIIYTQLEYSLFFTAFGSKSRYMRFEESLGVWPIAVAYRKDFCCKTEINEVISRIVSSGIVDKLFSDVSFKFWAANAKDIVEREKIIAKLRVEDITGPLLLLVTGYVLAILVLICEVIYYKTFRKF